ncbi:MAG: helix-turn-helix domain-containing protein [Clostridiales bacterium]|jgi:transcriptional regulator with XRE-family HTH domain|nr:helix-turn-helix domain-containing protein [Clostridiales bacterium]
MIKFGEKIKELRIEKKLLQGDIANFLNTTKQNVSRWENGHFEPSQENIIKLANFFGVTTDYLLGLENEDGTKIYENKAVQKKTAVQEKPEILKLYELLPRRYQAELTGFAQGLLRSLEKDETKRA